MQKITIKDLVIRLDERRKVLQFLVPKNSLDIDKLRIFYEISEDDVGEVDDLEHYIGAALLSFLSATYSSTCFHLDQYREAGKNFAETMSHEADRLATSGVADDEFEGARLLIQRFNDSWSIKDIEGITALLEKAASNGSAKAGEFLKNDWPIKRQIFEKRIARAHGD